MGKSKRKITNWKEYNQALVNRGSLTFWMDDDAIANWYCDTPSGRRGRSNEFSDSAIETALMLKGIFNLPLRALQGFIDSLFSLMDVDLRSPNYTSISKRARTVEVNYRQPPKGSVAHLVIDATGVKVFGEGEWKVRKHGSESRRTWRKVHFAVDADSHDIVSAVVSLDSVHDSEVLPALLNPLRRKIEQVSADGAYDTRGCYEVIGKKGAKAVIPPRKNAALWDDEHPRNEAVIAQQSNQLEQWKSSSCYHQRSLAETAMYRYKQLLSGKVTLRKYNGQVGEILANVKALNKLTSLGMPVRQRLS
jgi:hypothetical protein